jgi:hypothetical protein
MTLINGTQAFRYLIDIRLKGLAHKSYLNPNKSVDELNMTAKHASGNVSKTFVDVVKARFKG